MLRFHGILNLATMRASKYIGYLLLCFGSCVYPFRPEISENQELMVINGKITNLPGDHYVEVSSASPFYDPGFRPFSNCVVRVEDEHGEGITYEEYEPGRYRAYLDESFLGINKVYKLYVFTEDGKEYQSEYDTLTACPPVDSLYFSEVIEPTEDPEISYEGLQFYLDFKGESWHTKYYMWELEESFEYHSPYDIDYTWDGWGNVHEFIPPIDTLHICYKTLSVPKLYTVSTRYLVANEIRHFPLNYVSERLPYLKYRYSLLVRQYSLTQDAFRYWEKLRAQQEEAGGLYETQPVASDGNMYNVNDEGEQVLGYFYASQVHEKLIFVKHPYLYTDYFCRLATIDRDGLADSYWDVWMYLASLSNIRPEWEWGISKRECFDCRLRGGKTTPPYYWNMEK